MRLETAFPLATGALAAGLALYPGDAPLDAKRIMAAIALLGSSFALALAPRALRRPGFSVGLLGGLALLEPAPEALPPEIVAPVALSALAASTRHLRRLPILTLCVIATLPLALAWISTALPHLGDERTPLLALTLATSLLAACAVPALRRHRPQPKEASP